MIKDQLTKPNPSTLQIAGVEEEIKRQFAGYAKLRGLTQAEAFTQAFLMWQASEHKNNVA
jgi:hypothetical protein